MATLDNICFKEIWYKQGRLSYISSFSKLSRYAHSKLTIKYLVKTKVKWGLRILENEHGHLNKLHSLKICNPIE